YNQRGGHNAALHSKLQKAAGIKVDRDQVVATIMEWGGYRANQDVVTAWADNCSDAMDWLIDMAEKSGIKVILEPTTKDWYFPNYPTIHAFRPRHQETLAEMLIANCKARGVEFHFNSPAVQLIREDKGRVTGVIAKDPENGYARFDAHKGVIICTGDYGNDKEMVKKYCWPIISQLQSEYTYTVKSRQIINTGDGHKMGIWIGAAIDDPPHCALLFDWSSWAGWDSPYVGLFLLGRQPWLHVNNLWHPEQFESEIKQGHVLVAGSLEELAQKMEIPVDTFKATVARYNELARLGKDLDYGKHPDRLTTLEKPPFYTCKMDARYLVILAGLQINTRMQVLDTEGKVIPGLYAAGNASGSFFAYQYPTTVPGATHSRAFTFGRLAGRNAALGLS
ncbi:MAG: fumarate reductase flavoprotein subunit FccA, partial [Chloroflexi bacterium]|nr:fumarate reductase flavoprotein subunit FccA [Chloroflexota bacterium]